MVKIPPANFKPLIRCCAIEWELTSMNAYLHPVPEFAAAEKAIQDKIDWMMNIKGKKSVDSIHKELGHVMCPPYR